MIIKVFNTISGNESVLYNVYKLEDTEPGLSIFTLTCKGIATDYILRYNRKDGWDWVRLDIEL